MDNYLWADRFRKIYDGAVERYQRGKRSAAQLFEPAELAFLDSIGCTAQELFDFVDDRVKEGVPSFETVLLITAVRREFFLKEQGGKRSTTVIDMDRLPAKSAAVADIPWLPRIIEKAWAKLRGEMPAELMYCCGGDRAFLEKMNIHPADFLRVVWASGADRDAVVRYVVAHKQGAK